MKHEDILLRSMLAPTRNHSYLIGTFDTQITIHSQQIKALNLVYLLFATGTLKQGSRVAIIGGGISGLTAAAALLQKGCSVVLFEKCHELMTVQRGSHSKNVHPNIYNWPAEGSLQIKTLLPSFNWTSGQAHEIVKAIDYEWKIISKKYEHDITVCMNAKVKSSIESEHDIQITYSINNGPDKLSYSDVTIYAGGFGIEKGFERGDENPGYFADNNIHRHPLSNELKKIAIFGYGDGGLVEFQSACLSHFDSGKWLYDLAGEESVIEIGKQMVKIDRAIEKLPRRRQSRAFLKAYSRLKIPGQLIAKIEKDIKLYTHVLLFGFNPAPFRTNTSILNRLVCYILLYKIGNGKAYTAFKIKDLKKIKRRLEKEGYVTVPRTGTSPDVLNVLGLNNGPRTRKIIAQQKKVRVKYNLSEEKLWEAEPNFYSSIVSEKYSRESIRNIVPLFHSPAGIDAHHIQLRLGGESLFFRQNTPSENNATINDDIISPGFDRPMLKQYAREIDLERANAARLFDENNFSTRPLYNSGKVGVFNFQIKKNATTEKILLDLSLFNTDYKTHVLSRGVYKRIRAETSTFTNYTTDDFARNYRQYNFLNTSLGLYLLVIVKEGVLVTKRSKGVGTSEEAKWHVSMDKGLSSADLNSPGHILDSFAQRGLLDELGLSQETLQQYNSRIHYCDLFVDMKRYEMVLNGYLKTEMKFEDLKPFYGISAGGDGYQSTAIDVVPINKNAIETFLLNDCTEALQYSMQSLLARSSFFKN